MKCLVGWGVTPTRVSKAQPGSQSDLWPPNESDEGIRCVCGGVCLTCIPAARPRLHTETHLSGGRRNSCPWGRPPPRPCWVRYKGEEETKKKRNTGTARVDHHHRPLVLK